MSTEETIAEQLDRLLAEVRGGFPPRMTPREAARQIREEWRETGAPEWTGSEGMEFAVQAMLRMLDAGPRVAGEVR